MNNNLPKIKFYERPWLWKPILAVAMLASFGLRTINLKNPPLDFAGTVSCFPPESPWNKLPVFTNVPELHVPTGNRWATWAILSNRCWKISLRNLSTHRRTPVDCPRIFLLFWVIAGWRFSCLSGNLLPPLQQ